MLNAAMLLTAISAVVLNLLFNGSAIAPAMLNAAMLLTAISAVVLNLLFNGSGGDESGSIEAAKAH